MSLTYLYDIYRSVIIAVTVVHMMKPSVYKKIYMISMVNRFMAAVIFVPTSAVDRLAFIWILFCDIDFAFMKSTTF
jgi:hypothetical protein